MDSRSTTDAVPQPPQPLPHAHPVDPALLDACFTRACSRPEVQAVGPIPPLPDAMPTGSTRTRFCGWLHRYGIDDRFQSSEHPLWAALVDEGLDSRWTIDPGPPGDEGLGLTVLHVCCTNDLVEVLDGLARAMVQRGQPLDVLGGRQPQTPLAYAMDTGSLLTGEVLLNAGANALGDAPGGSLLWAVTATNRNRAHQAALIKRLLNHGAGARLDEPGENGLTPLHQAVRGEREPSVMMLLKAGADPRRLDPDQRSVQEVAHRRGLTAIAQRIDEVWVGLERDALTGEMDTTGVPETETARARARL